MFEAVNITRISQGKAENLEDLTASEAPFTININKTELATLLASPYDLKELAIGFLYTAGIIKSISDVENIVLDTSIGKAYIELKEKKLDENLIFKRLFTSGCGRGVIFYNSLDLLHRKKIDSNFNISSEKIFELMQVLQEKSTGFKKTGGVHSAALSDAKDIFIFKEDIGRHNAVDKVIGEALIKKINFQNSLILSSGRVSSEIVLKIKKAAIPIIVSQSAPTNQAVKLAREFGLTVIGFVRGRRMNIYSGDERVL